MATGSLRAAYDHCSELVRAHDPDRATATLFAAPERQDDLAALAAFDVETAAIPVMVSQPLPGEIRLQWWRDLLEKGGAGGSPVAEAFLHTVERRALPRELLDRFLEARIFDLYDDPMESVADLETYAGETHSTLLSMSARALGSDGRGAAGDVAGHGGVALTVLSILRLARRAPARAGKFVPSEMLAVLGVAREDWLAATGFPGPLVDALQALSREHLDKAMHRFAEIERPVRPAFLPLITLGRELDAAAADMAGRSLSASGALGRSLRYWRAMRRRS